MKAITKLGSVTDNIWNYNGKIISLGKDAVTSNMEFYVRSCMQLAHKHIHELHISIDITRTRDLPWTNLAQPVTSQSSRRLRWMTR